MKVKLLVGVLAIIGSLSMISTARAYEWRDGDGYRYKFTCEDTVAWQEPNGVYIFLHGEGGEGLSYEPSSLLVNGDTEDLFNRILDNCGIIVAPRASAARYFTWDFTGTHTANGEISKIISLLVLAEDLFDQPTNLIGGAAGGNMAFAVASRLNRIGRNDLIKRLVLVETISPFDIRVNGKLPAYDGIGPLTCTGPSSEYTLGGGLVENEECNFIRMGLPNRHASFDTDTLVVYSTDDDIAPEALKEVLAGTIVHYSTIGPATADIMVVGESHDISAAGWAAVGDFVID